MNVKAIAFDVDGTLFSSHMLIGKVYETTIKEINEKHHLNIKIPTLSEITPHIGKPSLSIYSALFPNIDPKYYSLIKDLNGQNFSLAIKNEGGILIPGVDIMFDELYNLGLMLFLASNANMPYLNAFTEKYNLPVTYPIIALNYTTRNVKADILEEYLVSNNLQPNEMIMVGDRIMDFDAARAHKVPFIGIEIEQYAKNSELKDAPYLVHSIPELTDLIKSLI